MSAAMDNARKRELIGGGLLFGAAILALLVANSPLAAGYNALLNTYFSVQFGEGGLSKPLILWINDGLMALFFLLIGIEVKREFFIELKPTQIALPAIAALGGMIVPALIFALFNWGDSSAMQGWAIPVATDIAFVLGVLALLGPRIPQSLRAFLLALAIFDDIGAIVVIAIFYTANLSYLSLALALLCLLSLLLLNRYKVTQLAPYILIGFLMWLFVLKSGVHATLAGVALGLMIPHLMKKSEASLSPMVRLEHALQPWVVYFVVPVFAFANAGLPLMGITLDNFFTPITLGVGLGLIFGKQIGIFIFTWAAIHFGFAQKLRGVNWPTLYAGAIVCGIGFTMSLFIASLAYQGTHFALFEEGKLGILIGSIVSGIIGYYLLKMNTR